MNSSEFLISGTEIVEERKIENGQYGYRIFKRLFDIITALIACVFLLPVIIIIKIAMLLQKDTKSIFFKQERIGLNGKVFYIYKFRSMVHNAEEILSETLKMNKVAKEEWEKYQKITNDPRITKIGKFLRNTSLDELPQFINVLKGEMSMIGPRPLVKGELDAHLGNHEIYESVKPGITGWWACNGRSELDYDERLKLEYYYVKNKGIKMDIKCVVKTITAVVCKKGAK